VLWLPVADEGEPVTAREVVRYLGLRFPLGPAAAGLLSVAIFFIVLFGSLPPEFWLVDWFAKLRSWW
jgi:hypothetical protein